MITNVLLIILIVINVLQLINSINKCKQPIKLKKEPSSIKEATKEAIKGLQYIPYMELIKEMSEIEGTNTNIEELNSINKKCYNCGYYIDLYNYKKNKTNKVCSCKHSSFYKKNKVNENSFCLHWHDKNYFIND